MTKIEERDARWRKNNVAILREMWGEDYSRNLRFAEEFLYSLPDGMSELLLNSRDVKGRLLGADANFIVWACWVGRGSDVGDNPFKDCMDELVRLFLDARDSKGRPLKENAMFLNWAVLRAIQ